MSAALALSPSSAAAPPAPVAAMLPLRPQADSEDDDVGLLAAYRGGDARAFERLYSRHATAIRLLCLRHLRSDASADDVVQETFLRLVRGADRVDRGFNVRAWLHRVAANLCIDMLRAQRRCPSTSDDGTVMRTLPTESRADQPEAALEMSWLRETVNRVADAMPPRQRAALVLRELEGLSYNAIAEELQLSPGAVETLLFRARRRFREEYLRRAAEADREGCGRTLELLGTAERRRPASRRGLRDVAAHIVDCTSCRDRVRTRPVAPALG
ncbi:MAG TPA: sigma-70 family RNA polymerase sigma factor [Candidatus Dormibacteraeota bacterium]